LPTVYLSEDVSLRANEIKTVLNQHITTETVEFITGARPLSEVDDFYAELKGMDVEEYIEIYREAYSTYMNSIFK